MNSLNKTILHIVAAFVVIYGAIWLFNHVNAWIGIGLILALIIFELNYHFNNYKNNKNEK